MVSIKFNSYLKITKLSAFLFIGFCENRKDSYEQCPPEVNIFPEPAEFQGFYRKYLVKSSCEQMLIWKAHDFDVQISVYANGKVI